ncbi:MAG: hypothetical protein ACOVMM_09680 [Chitinophagaceae bacterium]
MMKRLSLLVLIFAIISCNNKTNVNNYSTPETAFDAARQFIETTNKGKFDEATFMITKAANNDAVLDKLEQVYNKLTNGQKQELQEASINIHGIEDVNEKVSIVNYSNSFDKQVHKLKVVNDNGKWLIDIGYTFNGNL